MNGQIEIEPIRITFDSISRVAGIQWRGHGAIPRVCTPDEEWLLGYEVRQHWEGVEAWVSRVCKALNSVEMDPHAVGPDPGTQVDGCSTPRSHPGTSGRSGHRGRAWYRLSVQHRRRHPRGLERHHSSWGISCA